MPIHMVKGLFLFHTCYDIHFYSRNQRGKQIITLFCICIMVNPSPRPSRCLFWMHVFARTWIRVGRWAGASESGRQYPMPSKNQPCGVPWKSGCGAGDPFLLTVKRDIVSPPPPIYDGRRTYHSAYIRQKLSDWKCSRYFPLFWEEFDEGSIRTRRQKGSQLRLRRRWFLSLAPSSLPLPLPLSLRFMACNKQ